MNLAAIFKPRRLALVVCAVTALTLAGCASLQPQTSEQIVEARANQRWQHLIAGDVPDAYAMLQESYRQTTPYERYRTNVANGSWVRAKVISISCTEEVCTVRISLEAKPPLGVRYGGNITTGLDETWIRESGQWYFKPRP